jgi:hypothetical protein
VAGFGGLVQTEHGDHEFDGVQGLTVIPGARLEADMGMLFGSPAGALVRSDPARRIARSGERSNAQVLGEFSASVRSMSVRD